MNVVAAPIDHCEGVLDSRKNTFWDSPVRTWFRQWLDPEGPMIDAIRSSWPDREKMFTCKPSQFNSVSSLTQVQAGTRGLTLANRTMVPG
jgi:hypothetical protein